MARLCPPQQTFTTEHSIRARFDLGCSAPEVPKSQLFQNSEHQFGSLGQFCVDTARRHILAVGRSTESSAVDRWRLRSREKSATSFATGTKLAAGCRHLRALPPMVLLLASSFAKWGWVGLLSGAIRERTGVGGRSISSELPPADRPHYQSEIFFFKARRFGERRTSSLGFCESNQTPERDHRTKQHIIFRGPVARFHSHKSSRFVRRRVIRPPVHLQLTNELVETTSNMFAPGTFRIRRDQILSHLRQ
jgi:hypothetical protein